MPTDIITFWQSHKSAIPDSGEQWPLNWIATDMKFFSVRKRCEIIVHRFYLLKKIFRIPNNKEKKQQLQHQEEEEKEVHKM